MKITDTTWAIVDTDYGIRGTKPVFLDWTCARTRKQCIEEAVRAYVKPWAELRKRGLRCAKFIVQGEIRL